jgi:hypothetical protein
LKGVVFNLLEEVVSENAGEAAWERATAQSGVEGAYTSLGAYPHEELLEGADEFGEKLNVAQTTCEKRGDAECVFEVVVAK